MQKKINNILKLCSEIDYFGGIDYKNAYLKTINENCIGLYEDGYSQSKDDVPIIVDANPAFGNIYECLDAIETNLVEKIAIKQKSVNCKLIDNPIYGSLAGIYNIIKNTPLKNHNVIYYENSVVFLNKESNIKFEAVHNGDIEAGLFMLKEKIENYLASQKQVIL